MCILEILWVLLRLSLESVTVREDFIRLITVQMSQINGNNNREH